MKKDKIRVTNIQRMCFQDGPGIRSTVFLKGCSLHCPWCSNPENISFLPETFEKNGREGTYGRDYLAKELMGVLMKDCKFWENGGGVTFSGGEALMQADVLQEVLEQLKKTGVHIAVETALFVPKIHLENVMSYVDYFIVDVKILDPIKCRDTLGGDISVYLENVEILYQAKKLKLFRVPCCPEYTFTEENKKRLIDFFKKYDGVSVQIFGIHNLGEKKYESLKRPIWKSQGVEEKDLYEYREALEREGIKAEVIHI